MGLLSSYYGASFAGVSFWEQEQNGWRPDRARTTEADVWKRPASNSASLNDRGAGAEPFTLVAGVEGAEHVALFAKRGDAGTLIYSGGTISARLVDVLDTPGKAGDLDAYTISLRFLPYTEADRPSVSIQIDAATFPAHDITDITSYLAPAGWDVDLSTTADNGSAVVHLTSLPAAAVEGRLLYLYVNGVLIFNGQIAVGGTAWNADDTVTLNCVDALHKMRNAWGGPDRTYNSTGDPATDDTDTSTAQNWVEASGIDSTLTHIEGEDRPIGTLQDVVVHGGDIDPLSGAPATADNMLEMLRTLDKSTVPNFATYTRGDGAVYRTIRALGDSVATFTEGDNCWDVTRSRVPGSIVNKWLIKGVVPAGSVEIDIQATASAANSYLAAPFEYNTEEFTSPFIDDSTWAQDLADWKLAETNGRLNTVGWVSEINTQANILGSTVTMTSSKRALSSEPVYVTTLKHHGDDKTATTTYTAEFRD